jgi:hypothetical protein
MTVSLKHTFQSAKTDSADATLVQPSNWNQEHVLTAAAGVVLGRDTSGAGNVQELPISVTSAGNVTIPNNFAVTGTTGLTGTLGVTGTTTLTDLNVTGTTTLTNPLPFTSGGTGRSTIGTAGQVLAVNGAATGLEYIPPPIGAEIIRVARTSNTEINAANRSNLIDITSGTFSQTFAAAATLASGWFCYIRNSGTGDITLDPDGAETIDGLTSYIMYPGETRLVQCDGTALITIVLDAFYRVFTASGTFTKPPGYTAITGLLWGGGGSGACGSSQRGGGGGGACNIFTVDSAFLSASCDVTVGAGGIGVVSGIGNVGGTSTFDSKFSAFGGGGGSTNTGTGPCAGGGGGGALSAGSTTTGAASTTVGGEPGGTSGGRLNGGGASGFGGAGGDDGVLGSASYAGGASGGGAFSGASGSKAGGDSIFGGAGGAGKSSTFAAVASGGVSIYGGNGGGSDPTAGEAGSAPGGGGGASQTISGDGARGELRLWGIV